MSRSRATCLGPFSPDTLTKRAGHISSQDYNVSTVYNVHATLTPGVYLSLKLLHLFHFTKCLVYFTENGGNQRPFWWTLEERHWSCEHVRNFILGEKLAE